MTTSIVITAFNRNPQLAQTLSSIRAQKFDGEIIVVDDGDGAHGYPSAALLCSQFGARHIPCRRPASAAFRNPSYPNNVGIRAATGGIVILQNAECKHVDPTTIEKLTALVAPTNAVFARVLSLQQDGTPGLLYCGEENPRPYFFCGAIRREWLVNLRGFDEDFTGAGLMMTIWQIGWARAAWSLCSRIFWFITNGIRPPALTMMFPRCGHFTRRRPQRCSEANWAWCGIWVGSGEVGHESNCDHAEDALDSERILLYLLRLLFLS